MHDRKADVLESSGAHSRRLVEGPGLHGIAIVEDDLAACGLERLDLLLGRLAAGDPARHRLRSEEHTSELQSRGQLVCRLLLEKKNSQDRGCENAQGWVRTGRKEKVEFAVLHGDDIG